MKLDLMQEDTAATKCSQICRTQGGKIRRHKWESIFSVERFQIYVTAAILVFQNNETAAIVGVPKINPARVKRFFYVKAFFRGFQ